MSLGIMLFSKEIQTLDELHLALLHPAGGVECLDEGNWLYRFPDGNGPPGSANGPLSMKMKAW